MDDRSEEQDLDRDSSAFTKDEVSSSLRENMRYYDMDQRNGIAYKCAMAGYWAFLADHITTMHLHMHIIPCPEFIDRKIFYGQTTDVFAPPYYALIEGQYLCYKLHQLLEKNSPTAAEKLKENWRVARSALTLATLGAYEVFQGYQPGRHFDVPDMIAYSAGLALFMHGKDICHAAADTYRGTEQVVHKMFGIQDNKLH